MTVKSLLWIALGGGLGSVARFIGYKLTTPTSPADFPWGTLWVNLLGCLLIGIFSQLSSRSYTYPGELWLFLMTGLCGGFTTFSAFSLESLSLLQQQRYLAVLTYLTVSVLGGISCTLAGYWISRSL